MNEDLYLSNGNRELQVYRWGNGLSVDINDLETISILLTRVQALRLAEYIGEVFGD